MTAKKKKQRHGKMNQRQWRQSKQYTVGQLTCKATYCNRRLAVTYTEWSKKSATPVLFLR